jgi:5-methylcytosine-specific restriction protein A
MLVTFKFSFQRTGWLSWHVYFLQPASAVVPPFPLSRRSLRGYMELMCLVMRPKRPCSYPGCSALVSDGSRCDKHRKQEQSRYNKQRGSAASQGYGSRWRKIRTLKLQRSPLCQDCLEMEPRRLTPANEVHHIVALRDGGTHDFSNLMSLCKSCHSKRTDKGNGGFGR